MRNALSKRDLALIASIVDRYKSEGHELAKILADGLAGLCFHSSLSPIIHSVRSRVKDPDHLRDKLERKMLTAKAEGKQFAITPDNLFEKVTDLAGIRILHLHTTQFPKINEVLLRLLDLEEYKILEGPIARVWDDEYGDFFQGCGIQTQVNKRLYTSVHYIVGSGERNLRTGEIQVRTLAEELWGEVDHTINYPHKCEVATCQEQIKVLARVTSGATRLVDSIFRAKADAEAELATKHSRTPAKKVKAHSK